MTVPAILPATMRTTNAASNHQPAFRFLRFNKITAAGKPKTTMVPASKVPQVMAIKPSPRCVMHHAANDRYGSKADIRWQVESELYA